MADEIKQYQPPVIAEQPFPGVEQDGTFQISGGTSGQDMNVFTPTEVAEKNMPSQLIANTVISDSFDSQSRRILAEYQFTTNGAIAIGTYENGVSGDVRISPSGIIGRNSDGDTTFSLDATTGDATFKGTIVAGSLIAGRTDIGSVGGNIYIDGANNRIIISDGTHNRIAIGYILNGF